MSQLTSNDHKRNGLTAFLAGFTATSAGYNNIPKATQDLIRATKFLSKEGH